MILHVSSLSVPIAIPQTIALHCPSFILPSLAVCHRASLAISLSFLALSLALPHCCLATLPQSPSLSIPLLSRLPCFTRLVGSLSLRSPPLVWFTASVSLHIKFRSPPFPLYTSRRPDPVTQFSLARICSDSVSLSVCLSLPLRLPRLQHSLLNPSPRCPFRHLARVLSCLLHSPDIAPHRSRSLSLRWSLELASVEPSSSKLPNSILPPAGLARSKQQPAGCAARPQPAALQVPGPAPPAGVRLPGPACSAARPTAAPQVPRLAPRAGVRLPRPANSAMQLEPAVLQGSRPAPAWQDAAAAPG